MPAEQITARARRQAVMQQFELQLPKFPLEIIARQTNFRYLLRDLERALELRATVLERSWDFYEFRLNTLKQQFDLLIVQRHDCAVPVAALELDGATLFRAGTPPALPERPGRRKRNATEVKVLISQLIIGVDAALAELETMPERTRRRYLAERAKFLKPKRGRPWAS
jgi:hypothetical protein